MLRAGVFLLHDTVHFHIAQVAVGKAANCAFVLLLHPRYSPHLAPSDFFPFPKFKSNLNSHYLEAMIWRSFLEDQDDTFFRDGIAILNHRWSKCMHIKGEYIEKYIVSIIFLGEA